MAKQFKLLRIIPSLQCCRSNDISIVPTSTDPPSSPPSKPHHSSLRHHVSSAFRIVACGCRSSSTDSDDDQIPKSSPKLPQHVPPTPLHVCYECDDVPKKKRRRLRKKKSKSTTTFTRLRISTSSAKSGLFSSESCDEIDELEETETLISSSKTISTINDEDSSSEFNPQWEIIRYNNPYNTRNKINLKKKKEKEKRRRTSNRRRKQRRIIKTSPPSEIESSARLSVFQRLIPCTVDGKIRESFAVVKKSKDPFHDFKRSMMEMIMEKEMFDEKDLEQLLHCLLSLNDREHHEIIVEAFSEIWLSLFCNK